MADYSHLAKLAASEDTLAEYVFTDIPGRPSIWCAPATDDNQSWRSERARMVLRRAKAAEHEAKKRRTGAAPEVTPEMILKQQDEELEEDRLLISRCCAKRWGVAPRDVDGNQPEFSEEECYAFLKAVPNWMFKPLAGWASSPRNFVTIPDEVDESDGEELGNS